MPKSNQFTRIYRIARILIHTTTGLTIAAVVLPFIQKNTKLTLIKWWCGGLLRAFNIKVVTFGDLPAPSVKGVMFVANHISWSDIHALNSLIPLRFIAKSDIKNWPVFGYLVQKADTLFIDRNKRQEAGRIVDITAESLKSGDNLCFFPEGTTTDGAGLEGARVLPFKGSVLQAAISANTQVWPVAIKYVNANGSINTAMAYAGETTLIASMHQVLMQKTPVVELHFLQPIHANGQNRRELTQNSYDAILAKLT
ncbi:MAG: lysophospholipid acyltransferase family protein [Methylotenera sp.]